MRFVFLSPRRPAHCLREDVSSKTRWIAGRIAGRKAWGYLNRALTMKDIILSPEYQATWWTAEAFFETYRSELVCGQSACD